MCGPEIDKRGDEDVGDGFELEDSIRSNTMIIPRFVYKSQSAGLGNM
jgi:hypothetical protein